MTKRFLVTVGIMGFFSIILGAMGTHMLDGHISEDQLYVFDTANGYIMFHALALLGLIALKRKVSISYLNTIYFFFVVGVTFLSGIMIISSLKELTGFDNESISFFAPIGEAMLVLGWISIIMAGFSYKHKKSHH